MLEIKDSIEDDVFELVNNLRDEDQREADLMGLDPAESLLQATQYAVYKKSIFLDGEMRAMGGVAGNLFGSIGALYLLTSRKALELSPIKFFRIYKREVQIMSELFPTLTNYVDASYTGAVRMLSLAGFDLEGPFEYGPDKAPFIKFTLKTVN